MAVQVEIAQQMHLRCDEAAMLTHRLRSTIPVENLLVDNAKVTATERAVEKLLVCYFSN